MIRVVLAFLIVFGLFFFGIKAVRALSGKEKWELTKLLSYSLVCATLTLAVLIGIVILF